MKKTSLKDAPKLSQMISGPENPEIKRIFIESQLNPRDEIPKPEIVFGIQDSSFGDVWVGSKGNISLLKGAQKSRKTFATSAIAAAVAGMTKAIAFKSFADKPAKVLYVDTEQARYDCKKVLKRMLCMSKIEIDNFENNFTFLTLRQYSPNIRREVIRHAMKEIKDISLVIIDGIRDLVMDINDSTESTEIVTDLMAWSTEYNIHILNVLHENKSNQNARGHLGTELQNKCESVLRISKIEKDQEFSVIESVDMRGMSFNPVIFEIQENDEEIAIPIIAEDVELEIVEKKGKQSKHDASSVIESIPETVHVKCIRAAFVNEQGMFDNVDPLSAREFNRRIKKAMQDNDINLSDHKARSLTDYYLKKRLLTDLNEDEESKVKKLVPGFDDDIPF